MKETTRSPRQWAFVVVAGGAACALPFVQPAKTVDQSPRDFKSDGSFLAHSSAEPITLADIAPPEPEQRLPDWVASRSPFDDLTPPTRSLAKDESVIAPLEPLRPWISGPSDFAPGTSIGNSVATTPSNTIFKSERSENGGLAGDPLFAQAPGWNDQTPFATSIDDNSASRNDNLIAVDHRPDSVGRWPDQGRVAGDVMPPQLAQQPPQTIADPHRNLVSALVDSKTISPLPSPVGPSRRATLSRNPNAVSVAAQRTFGQTSSPVSPTLETPIPPLPTLPAERKERIIFQPSLRKQH